MRQLAFSFPPDCANHKLEFNKLDRKFNIVQFSYPHCFDVLSRQTRWSLCLAISVGWNCCSPPMALTQVVPDNTLAPNETVVTTGDSANEVRVTGGTQVDRNLFHSFESFSIPNGGGVVFINNNPQITNIFGRITGNSISQIDGYINSGGNSPNFNLFLINPNGIIFGSGATLNIGGDFFASTAESIIFQGDREFSAVNPNVPLLTIDVPIGLQFGANPNKISLQQAQLKVVSGQNLGLIAGEIEIDGALLSVPNGRLDLGGVGSNSFVGITAIDSGLIFNYADNDSWGKITLANNSLAGTETTIDDRIGDINITTGDLQIIDSQIILNTDKTGGSGSNLSIDAKNKLEIAGAYTTMSSEGSPLFFPAGLFVSENGSENGGSLNIDTEKLILRDGGQIFSSNSAVKISGAISITAEEISILRAKEPTGIFNRFDREAESNNNDRIDSAISGGSIQIETSRLSLVDGAQISTSTFGMGDAGKIIINAREELTISNQDVFTAEDIFSGIFAQVNDGSRGNGGDIEIDTPRLILQGPGSLISATTYGEGNGGNVIISGQEIYLSDGAQIQAATIGEGTGGTININAERIISLTGFSTEFDSPTGLVTSTDSDPDSNLLGTAKAGDINIITDELIISDGGIVSASTANLGQGGTIEIEAREIEISGSSSLSVRASSLGNAGDIDVKTTNLFLDSRSEILAGTNSSDGGNIFLKVDRILNLRDGSTISTTAGIAEDFGNGGNINIDAGFLIALPNENSDIIANAFRGNGGNITIATRAIFGLHSSSEITDTSDITSSSRLGIRGEVKIDNPEIDTSQGLILLSQQTIDLSRSVIQTCATSDAENRFTVTGKGGLPPQPQEIIFDGMTIEDLGDFNDLEAQVAPENLETDGSIEEFASSSQIVEAVGWQVNDRGKIVLVADNDDLASLQTNRSTALKCQI
jgi:filamentous hemagglutinin family protein